MLLGSALLLSLLVFGFYGIGSSIASSSFFGHDDDDDKYHYRNFATTPAMRADANLYREECGGCHMVYPPQLLPPTSWSHIMGSLENHFDDNAQLDTETRQKIEQFLITMSTSQSGQLRRSWRNMKIRDIPLRITQTTYIKRKHREIPDRYISKNKDVRSLSQCIACHNGAERGHFDEHEVVIPGVGRWDD